MNVALACHDEIVRAGIAAAGGYVFKTLGDAFCAAFAEAPSALVAAVEIQRALKAAPWPEATPIRVRMGLHSGCCEERDGDYFGPVVNRAARLEAVAHGGQIVVSSATAELVVGWLGHDVSLLDMGEHRLKDLGRPERVFQVCAEGLPKKFAPLRSVDTPGLLVGREDELGRLQVALDQAVGGQGGLGLVSGEPGIGKTRLVEELAARATHRGAVVVWGRIDEAEGAPPYWPWVQVLSAVLAECDRDLVREVLEASAGVVSAILPEVKEYVANVEPPPSLGPFEARFRLHQAVVDLLVRLTRRQRLVVVLEDLHWADVASLELTRFVADRITAAPVLLVVTYRSVDAGSSTIFDDVLASMARNPKLARIALGGLSEAEVGHFIAQTINVEPTSSAVSAVHARTEGNPFFVGELSRLLESEGLLQHGRSSQRDHGPVPAGVRDVVRRRLARLPADSAAMLAVCAVIGRDFDLAVLAAASAIREVEALDKIEPALSAGLVSEDAALCGRFRFSHALIRDTVYGELSAVRRATLHAQVGTAVEQQRDDARSQLADLAWHFFHAAPIVGPERGIDYTLTAAQAAQAAMAYEQAEADLRRALTLIKRTPAGPARWERELEVQNRLVALMVLTHGFAAPEVGQACARAQQLCQQIGETDALFKALNNLANFHHVHGDLSIEMELAGQLLTIGNQRSNTMWLTAGYLFLGMAQLQAGRLRDAHDSLATLREVTAALDLTTEVAESFFGLHPRVMALMYSARSAWTVGEDAQAHALAAEGVRLATELGHPHTSAFASYFATHLEVLLGNASAVVERATNAIAFCGKHGLTAYQGWFRLLRGWAFSELGNADEGVPAMAAEVAANRTSGALGNTPFFLSLQAAGETQLGNRSRALALVEEALAEIGEDRLWESDLYRRRGELIAAQGPAHNGEAEDSLRRALSIANAQGAVPFKGRAEAALTLLGHI
jgi:predicted ATPase